jgi:hypothetical protein
VSFGRVGAATPKEEDAAAAARASPRPIRNAPKASTSASVARGLGTPGAEADIFEGAFADPASDRLSGDTEPACGLFRR